MKKFWETKNYDWSWKYWQMSKFKQIMDQRPVRSWLSLENNKLLLVSNNYLFLEKRYAKKPLEYTKWFKSYNQKRHFNGTSLRHNIFLMNDLRRKLYMQLIFRWPALHDPASLSRTHETPCTHFNTSFGFKISQSK